MKKALFLILALVMCLSLCACSDASNNNDTPEETQKETAEITQAATKPSSNRPTVESVVNGIKYEFKDPDSVQVSDVAWAYVEKDGQEMKNEFYIICTVRAKNSFGGYADPQAYVIHCKDRNYRIVEEYNDFSYKRQIKFDELGCGTCKGLE